MKKSHILTIGGILLLGVLLYFLSVHGLLSSWGKETGLVSAQDKPDAAPPASSADVVGKPPDEKGPPEIEIPPDRQKLIKVKTVEAAKTALRRKIRTVGRIEFDERKLTTVNLKYEGWIDELYADYVGKYVKQGEPLAAVLSWDVMKVQMDYLYRLRWFPYGAGGMGTGLNLYGMGGMGSGLNLAMEWEQLRFWGFSEQEIREIIDSRELFERITIRSPVSGYIFEKPVFKGSHLDPGDKMFDIVDLSEVWVLADLYEYEIPFLEVGQPARITLSYLPGKTFESRVDYIYPFLTGRTRTLKARFVISNPDMVLKPQMFTNVEIEVELGERLTIPTEAFLDTGLRQIVYVDKGDGFFQRKEVKIGLRGDARVEVLAGIEAGERVVSRPVFLVDSEAKLKGIAQ